MKLQIGSVVYMKAESGLIGYGNPQCVSWVSDELGELSLYGHNEHYKTYHVAKIVETGERKFSLKEALEIWNVGWMSRDPVTNIYKQQYFKEKFGIEI